MISTKDLKIKFLGITPVLSDDTGTLTPQQLVAFSGLLTYSGRSIDIIHKEALDKGLDMNKRMAGILRASSLKGHASMATTPVITISYEGSKFLDSAMTGLIFSSSIMASGRRTDTTIADIDYPSAIQNNPEALKIYREASEKNINFFNWLLAQKVQKDETSKILQYGIYGTGIIQLPIESIVSLKREYDAQIDWMPEEMGYFFKIVEKELKHLGVDLLYATRVIAPRNVYPYPNIFRDPDVSNLAREVAQERKEREAFKIISGDFLVTDGLKERLEKLDGDIKAAVAQKTGLKDKWLGLLADRQAITRDYALSSSIKVFSSVAWRVWSEKKRHRTVPMVVDSIYYSARSTAKTLIDLRSKIVGKSLNEDELNAINDSLSLPPTIRNNVAYLYPYLERALDSMEAYDKLVKMGIKERDALFVAPRALKLQIIQDYNLYNLITGYYPLRLCATVDEELRRMTIWEVAAIKDYLDKKDLGWLAKHIVPKCQEAGFCLEGSTCGAVKALVPDYDENFHKEMHADLEIKFKNILNEL
jgi:hypothetical protein